MPSKTSYFNKGIFLNNIKRFWLITFSYTFFLFLFVVGYLNYIPYRLSSSFDNDPVQIAANLFSQSSDLMVFFLGFYCLIAALAVFSYIHFPRNTAMIHSLPLKRETLFSSNYLAGLFIVTFPLVFNFLIIIIGQAVMGIPLGYAFGWLGVNLSLTFLLYTFAVFAGMFTGHMAAQVFYYLIFNFLAVFLEYVINHILSDFLFGFSSTSLHSRAWSPLYYVITLFRTFYSGQGDIAAIVGYITAGILFLVSALLLYKKRHMEVATDVISFKVVKPIFKYSATFCSSALLGGLMVAVFDINRNPAAYVAVYLLGGFIGYFVCEMLLQKKFRVFNAYKGFVVYGIILVLLFSSVIFDFFGYETSIPEESQIDIMYVYNYFDDRANLALSPEEYDVSEHRYIFNYVEHDNPPARLSEEHIATLRRHPGVADSREAIAKARLIHQYIIENKNLFKENFNALQNADNQNQDNFMNRRLVFKYKLKDGRIIERAYSGLVTYKDNTNLDTVLRDYLSLPEVKAKYEPILTKTASDINSITIDIYAKGISDTKYINDINGFLEAYKKDIEEVDPLYRLYSSYKRIYEIDLHINISFKERNPFYLDYGRTYENNYHSPINHEFKNTINYLLENGIIDRDQLQQIVTEEHEPVPVY